MPKDLTSTVSRLRKVVKETHSSPVYFIAENYIKEVVDSIIILLQVFKVDIKILSREDISEDGQVKVKDVMEVVKEGNLRERMTLILNFARKGCHVIWKVIHMYLSDNKGFNKKLKGIINEDRLIDRICRIGKNMGIFYEDRKLTLEAVSEFLKVADKNASLAYDVKPNKSACLLASLSKEGPVTATRLTFPLGTFRVVNHIDIQRTRQIKVGDALPFLSTREREFLFGDKNGGRVNEVLPWSTGYSYFSLLEDHIYFKQCVKFNHDYICGPSGNTDLQLDIFTLFNNFDIDIGIVACVLWMCYQPHHSIHEIFLGAIPYGFQYDPFIKTKIPAEYGIYNNILQKIVSKNICNATLSRRGPVVDCGHFNKDKVLNTVKCQNDLSLVPYHKLIGEVQYVLGRDFLLNYSGFKELSKVCSSIETLNLPWRDYSGYVEKPVKGFAYWNPRINNDFIRCAMNNIEKTPIRILLHDFDVDFIKGKRVNLTASEKLVVGEKEITVGKVSIFAPNNAAQSVVENCQIFFYYEASNGFPLKILLEKTKLDSTLIYYTAFVVSDGYYKRNKSYLQKHFTDITKKYKELLVERMKTRYQLSIYNKEGLYTDFNANEKMLDKLK